MNESSGRPPGQTLGACVLSLTPGDPCPFCGEPLKQLKTSGPARQLTVLSECEPADGGALVCAKCGCEVVGEEDPSEGVSARSLSAAA
jgi:hypothetical protein